MKLVLVGPPLSDSQCVFAKKEGCHKDIIQVADITDDLLRALYSNALALVFPSLYEGFGWPPLEAQACGCPVVASPLGSLSEILENGGGWPHVSTLQRTDPPIHDRYRKYT